MSNNPTPPDCIAKAIALYGRNSEVVHRGDERMAQAVWDALCAEGRTAYLRRTSSLLYYRHVEDADRVLVVPVGVCSPRLTRDAKQEDDQ